MASQPLGAIEAALLLALALALFFAWKLFGGGGAPKPEKKDDATEPDVKEEEDSDLVPMTVIFGSQTGTAEEFSETLAKEAKKNGFKATVKDIEEYDHEEELPNESFVVFLMSTFGEGQPTDSATNFDMWMKEQEDTSLLSNVTFCVFALGNKQYEKFCAMGKRTDKYLGRMGGQRLMKCGIGDDDASIEDDFMEWKEAFFAAAGARFATSKSEGDEKFTAEWTVDILDGKEAETYNSGFKPAPEFKDNIEMAKVITNKERRQKCIDGGSTREVIFDISDLSISYITADNLGIYPMNDPNTVQTILKKLHTDPDTVFRFQNHDKHLGLPAICSAKDVLLWHLDINNPPKKSLLNVLAGFAGDEKEANTLKSWASPAGKEEYKKNIEAPHMTILGILEAFPSLDVSFGNFVELVPKIQPRFYTISSSSNAQPSAISITMSVLKGGVCTNYLKDLKPGSDYAPIFVRPSTFRLPSKISTPIIMVGPGTGLAPFMGFVQEYEHKSKANGGKPAEGERVLFFGCRKRDVDFIYREELTAAKESGVLTGLQLAFSREEEKKVYVQHLISQQAQALWKMLSGGGYVYVCGATAMGRDVKEAFVEIARSEGDKSAEEAKAMLDTLQDSGRYVQELWST